MIVTTNILLLPFFVVIWAIDSYLFVLTVRLFLYRLRKLQSAIGQPVVHLTEPSRRAMERLIVNRLHLHPSTWGVWLALAGLLVLLRTGLVLLLV